MTKISNQYSLTNILTADLANSRLGINNVSPAYSLDLTGTARVTTSAYFATASGSVGIGTTSPSTKLHVYEALTNTTAYLTIQNNRARNAAVYTQTTNGGFYAGTSIGTDTFNYQIYDAVAGEARLTIASTGAATFASANAKTNTGNWNQTIYDTSTMAAGVGGGISFCGNKATSTLGLFAAIDGYKENATSANELGGFRIWTSNGTNLVERMRINSAGNVGINTTTPAALLQIGASANTESNIFLARSTTSTSTNIGGIRAALGPYWYDATSTSLAEINFATDSLYYRGAIVFSTNNSDATANRAVERMRITSGGSLLVGRTTGGLSNGEGATISGGSIQLEATSYVFYGNRTTSDGLFIGIRRNNVDVGSITVTTSATAFNTSSDYRLKTDFKDYNGLSLINLIKTYDYAWAIDNTRSYGVKAHELQELLPYMVFGEKDATNEDNSIKPQAVDYSKLVPVLVKAIQELSAKVSLLENK